MEQYTTLGQSVLASGYTAGSGSIAVGSASSFPAGATFRVQLVINLTPGALNPVYKVTSVSGATFSITLESGTDTSALSGVAVVEVLTAAGLDQIRADISQVGAYASLPVSGMKAGDRYYTTDSPYMFVFDGSVWQAFVGSHHVARPVLTDFSWRNQGSATVDTSKGCIVLTDPANAGSDNVHSYIKAPYNSTPWSVVALIRFPNVVGGDGICGVSALLASTGAGRCIGLRSVSAPAWNVISIASNTSWSGGGSYSLAGSGDVWIKITNSGSVMKFYAGSSRESLVHLSSSDASSLSVDLVGISANAENTVTDYAVVLLSWEEFNSVI